MLLVNARKQRLDYLVRSVHYRTECLEPASNNGRKPLDVPANTVFGQVAGSWFDPTPYLPKQSRKADSQKRSRPSLDCWNTDYDITSTDNLSTHPTV